MAATPMTLTEFIAMASSILDVVKTGMGVFMEPPLVWFVAMAFLAAVLGMAQKFIPKKKAK